MTAQLCGILEESWKTSCERLHQDGETPEVNQLIPTFEMTDEDEPNILFDEVSEALNATRKRKALDCDGIEPELWQALGENEIKAVW